MRYCVKRALCLLLTLSMLLALTATFTLSTTASPASKGPMIAIGNNFMIVQTASGEVWGWGDNSTGVLGNAYSETTGYLITSPIKIELPQNITSVSISAGYDHVLMLGSDGNVYAWGHNDAGQLGKNSDVQTLKTPTLVDGLRGKNIVAVSAGRRFSLALTDGGRVYSFGANNKLQLGYEPTTEFSETPTLIDALSGVFVKQINAGYESATVVDINGKVWLWGATKNHLLGVTSSPDKKLPFSDGQSIPATVASALSVNHSAFLLENGQVGCMGWNQYGQYGGGREPSESGSRFFRIADETATLGVTAIAVSNFQTVLLTVDGKVFVAGARVPNNADGAASNTFVPLFGNETKVPAAVTIAAGYQNGAMIAQDGSIWTWGDNSCGQLGNGSSGEAIATPTKVLMQDDSDFDMGQAPTVMGVPMKFTTSVPAPTYSIVIPATIDVGELRQADANDPNRYNMTSFTVEAKNVSNLFGEKEIQVSVKSGDINGIFALQDGNGGVLPFELFAEENAQTPIRSGDVFVKFTGNDSVETWIRIDQSKISQSGIYNGVLIFSYTIEDID